MYVKLVTDHSYRMASSALLCLLFLAAHHHSDAFARHTTVTVIPTTSYSSSSLSIPSSIDWTSSSSSIVRPLAAAGKRAGTPETAMVMRSGGRRRWGGDTRGSRTDPPSAWPSCFLDRSYYFWGRGAVVATNHHLRIHRPFGYCSRPLRSPRVCRDSSGIIRAGERGGDGENE